MKKITAIALVLTMALSLFAGCGAEKAPETEAPTEAPTEAAVSVEGTMEELLNKVVEQNPVEFMGGVMPWTWLTPARMAWLICSTSPVFRPLRTSPRLLCMSP